MLQWMFYVVVVSAVVSVAAVLAEHALRRRQLPTRSIWLIALALSVSLALRALPALPAPVDSPTLQVSRPIHQPVLPIRLPDVSPAAYKGARVVGLFRLEASLQTLWVGLSALMLVGLALSALQVYRRRHRWPMRMVDSHCVGVSKDVGPAVVGLIRPTIVLPEWVLARAASEQRLIVAHEASHLLARDPLLLTVAILAVLLLPWNPLLWWQLHRLRHAIEVDCDARVLGAGHDLATYGEALIEVGQRRSRYLGTVAAMSENRTLLEERIDIMSQRTRKPLALGLAALSAAVSLSVAVAATQVATPEAAGAAGLTLDTATLDRYVGHYQLQRGASSILTIARDGTRLNARITGQPILPIYADSPTEFHWEVVPARITFSDDAGGPASRATIHQNGVDTVGSRIDDSVAAQIEQQLANRIAARQPQPGTEAALRKTVAAMLSGSPNYSDMVDPLQTLVRKQKPVTDDFFAKLGAVETIEFRGVSENGTDRYLVTHQSGKQSQWMIQLGSDNRISTLAVMPVF